MSRAITTRTEIKDKELAVLALNQAGISFREQSDDVLVFTSGKMANARLYLQTGEIIGDSDFGHTKSSMVGMLRQHYSEVQFLREAQKVGTTIDQRETDQEGNIVLMWHMA